MALKKILVKPFKFIRSDVADLHGHLVEEYDVVNLSNIFDWGSSLMESTLSKLKKHVRVGGMIVCSSFKGKFADMSFLKDWAKVRPYPDFMLIERTR